MVKNDYPYAKQGAKLCNLIDKKGYSIYGFSKMCKYSKSRMYRLCRGQADMLTVQFINLWLMTKNLGFKHVDDLIRALGIDIDI